MNAPFGVRYHPLVSDVTKPRAGNGAVAFAPGTLIDGKFRVEGIIGAGGMGTVLAAHHIGLDKPVALKVLRDSLGGRSATQRLLREARAVAQLESVGVARVLDVGSVASGSPYIVMERLVGLDFGALLRIRGPLPVDEAVRYVIEACAPLEEAHGVGIVHRDLKPQNIFLAETKPGRKVVKVLDFGISRFDPTSPGAAPEEALTAQHEILGTPLYMPPEQISGARHADARSDVYSLGACLYHFVRGRPPIVASGLSTVLSAIRNVVPARLDEDRPDVPRALADVVARCLEKAPDARFPSIQALREALDPLAPTRSTEPRLVADVDHLDDDDVLALQERRLDPAALSRAQQHVVTCVECRELVALAAESVLGPLTVTGAASEAATLPVTAHPDIPAATIVWSAAVVPATVPYAVAAARMAGDTSSSREAALAPRGSRRWWPLVLGGLVLLSVAAGALVSARSPAPRLDANANPEATASPVARATSVPTMTTPEASAVPVASVRSTTATPRPSRGATRKIASPKSTEPVGADIPDER